MINIRELTIYKKNQIVLDNASAQFCGKVVVFGGNNTGKTKLIEAICGRTKIEAGEIVIDEKFVLENNISPKNKRIMFIPKNFQTFLGHLKTKNIVNFLTGGKKSNSKLLEEGGLLEGSKFKELTKIQKLILFIDIGLKNEIKIFVFDEPLLYLDMYERLIFKKIIQNYLEKSIVIITSNHHDENFFEHFNRKYYINEKLLKKV